MFEGLETQAGGFAATVVDGSRTGAPGVKVGHFYHFATYRQGTVTLAVHGVTKKATLDVLELSLAWLTPREGEVSYF